MWDVQVSLSSQLTLWIPMRDGLATLVTPGIGTTMQLFSIGFTNPRHPLQGLIWPWLSFTSTWRTSPSLTHARTVCAIHCFVSLAHKEAPAPPHSQEPGKQPLREKRWTQTWCPNLLCIFLPFGSITWTSKIGLTCGRHMSESVPGMGDTDAATGVISPR